MHIGETNRKPPGLGRMTWSEIKKALDQIEFIEAKKSNQPSNQWYKYKPKIKSSFNQFSA